MKIKFVLFILIFFFSSYLTAEDIEIISDNIKIFDDGNIINSTNTQAIIKDENLFLQSDKSLYDKKKQKVYLEKNVKFLDQNEDINIITNNAVYDQFKDILITDGKTIIYYKNKYEILSKKIIYNRKTQKIYSNSETTIKDNEGNLYNIQTRFNLDLVKNIISAKSVNIIDNRNNIFFFENSKINLNTNEIIGKEVKIDFVDNYFGNSKNDPILKGKSTVSNNKETKIYKTVFTTCNTENKSCPGWEIETEEFKHDKIKKTFNYKNSWIKMFDKEIFYLPFFSHPDPTVNRKSGFLPPTYGSSNEYGSWINIPYYKAFAVDKDFTFKPRVYLDDKIVLQSEYRQAFENSNFITDFSYNNDGKNSNSHFFAKSTGIISNGSNFNFEYQSVTNDEYLKLHNLSNTSEIISNESLLTSKLYLKNQIDEKTSFINEFFVYEDLSKKNNDRYQYIFPNFKYKKEIGIEKNYNGNFYFSTSGYQKQYNTNNYQAVITNDFLFNSNNYISDKGLKSNYQILLKQDNSYTSTPLDDKDETNLYQSILFKTEYPLVKKTENFDNYLKPIIATKFSPNNSKDISNKELRLSYDNIFSFNRISSTRNIEEGRSVSVGVEYGKNNKKGNNIFKFNIANSISDKKNSNLPSRSKLDQTRSDIVGKLEYQPSKILDINYNFSYDRDFNNSNYQSLSTNLKLGILETKVNYLSQDNEIGNSEVIKSNFNLNFDNENSINFNTTKNLKTDFTEFYNLVYEYETDCLLASVEYKKKFYQDGSILPDKSLLFYLKFIPFAELRPQAAKL